MLVVIDDNHSFQPDPEKVAHHEVAELPHATYALRLKQETPDPLEALKIVPSLSLQKIPKEPIHVPTEVGDVNGVKVLQHDLFTNDVLYTEIVFNMKLLKQELFPLVPLFWEAWVEKVVKTPYMTPTTSPPFFTPPFITPISPYNQRGFNPLFETTIDAEFNRLKSLPPPNIKVLTGSRR
ncbi:hypothetical protein JHK85_040749 [Glycine max]|uniref:Presequence protease 1, chloroplastic/mitochondrial n=1 Tax=Glycine soja TaxID=3848 RepID=A0A0B2S2U0_GLYSO|nr:hypothetical protein JHK86_040165 [Glycine max]KAG4965774.1 hypothetical protein JHK85_040749 [Glycine max]KHN38978.1 Presequence protease 1, chloroplastic/mitochondrial [Glycine soja]